MVTILLYIVEKIREDTIATIPTTALLNNHKLVASYHEQDYFLLILSQSGSELIMKKSKYGFFVVGQYGLGTTTFRINIFARYCV